MGGGCFRPSLASCFQDAEYTERISEDCACFFALSLSIPSQDGIHVLRCNPILFGQSFRLNLLSFRCGQGFHFIISLKNVNIDYLFRLKEVFMRNNSPIKERILQFIQYKGISRYRFYKECGITRGVLDKKSGISEDNIAKFIAFYPEIRQGWLLTGEGPMLKSAYRQAETLTARVAEDPVDYSILERGDAPADSELRAGRGAGDMLEHFRMLHHGIPEFQALGVDFIFEVKGDDMYPTYQCGDRMLCKKLPLDSFFQWKKLYVLDTVQGNVFKRVEPSTLEHHIRCVAVNPDYPPFDLPLEAVHGLAIALGFVRFTA